MRIAFDLDDTLVRTGSSLKTEPPPLGWLANLVISEPLREGTSSLLKELKAQGWQIWVYTSSFRSRAMVRLNFLAYGIPLGGVVNQDVHDQTMEKMGKKLLKYPPAFGIDLLVDDSVAVYDEGRTEGYEVVLIDPSDPEWCERVRRACARR